MNKDELDGFIYLPNKALKSGFAYIIEAKNYRNGENDATKQLEETKKFFMWRCECKYIYVKKVCIYGNFKKIQLILYLNITLVDYELIKMYANLNYEDKRL